MKILLKLQPPELYSQKQSLWDRVVEPSATTQKLQPTAAILKRNDVNIQSAQAALASLAQLMGNSYMVSL